ncbi:MAG: NAD(P)H-hydrate dehydratase [Candidatus Lokiarchaeota archaeon]|nr:NAD(P)H-hydrate dehydratase [Candidatus Lokiarchaeota archaeon]
MERLNSEKISSAQISILDNNTEWLGIPKTHLMECAGYSFAMEVIRKYYLDRTKTVLILCGTGNNGGDGFVIGRHLSSVGIKCKIILIGTPEKIRTKEAKLNWEIIYNSLNYSIENKIIKDSSEIKEYQNKILKGQTKYNLIIDGLLGTGIKGKLKEPISSAIDFINTLKLERNIPVVSIDVPSGLNPNTGDVEDKAIKANLVITFHRNKTGMNIDNEYIEEIIIKPIGIPEEAFIFIGRGDLLPTLKKRNYNSHKGEFGRMLVIGGSKNYSGAPAYSSLTGINFGIDLVITYTPHVIADILRSYSPNMIVRSSPGDWLNMKAYNEIALLSDWAYAILIGPGLGEEKETEELLVNLLKKYKNDKKKFVLDADALKLVRNHHDLIKGQNCILTPHENELKVMTKTTIASYNNISKRSSDIFKIAKKLDLNILLKGSYDYISNGKLLKINKTGCPEMAIGGTGDVLAGLCTSFIATRNPIFESACSGAFLNGYIGEFCKKKIGPRFTAMDMITNINNSIQNLI